MFTDLHIFKYNKYCKYFYSFCFLIFGLLILSFNIIGYAKGQLEVNGNETTSTNATISSNFTRQLNVIFESIKINNDHDLLFPAEWIVDAYVNNQSIPLLEGSDLEKVENGQTIILKNKSANVMVSLNDSLRIVTVGIEFDRKIRDYLPNISGILDNELPLAEYKNKAEDSIVSLITMDRNDAIGIIAKEFNSNNNFGIGKHDDCSEPSGEAGDLYDTVDTNCDFRLRYTIK